VTSTEDGKNVGNSLGSMHGRSPTMSGRQFFRPQQGRGFFSGLSPASLNYDGPVHCLAARKEFCLLRTGPLVGGDMMLYCCLSARTEAPGGGGGDKTSENNYCTYKNTPKLRKCGVQIKIYCYKRKPCF
jgi:hypothetical protein